MSLSQLSPAEVAYLKVLHRMNETNQDASVSALAKKFGVRLPSTIEILSKLEKKGLVVRKPWKIPELSRRGSTLTALVMHQHRILEVYLNRKLGVDSDLSCDQAGRVDYLMDSKVIQRMCQSLNRPAKCLHGYAIHHQD